MLLSIYISLRLDTKITPQVSKIYIEIIVCSILRDFAFQQAAADLSLLSSFGSSTSFGLSFDNFPSVLVLSSVASSLN